MRQRYRSGYVGAGARQPIGPRLYDVRCLDVDFFIALIFFCCLGVQLGFSVGCTGVRGDCESMDPENGLPEPQGRGRDPYARWLAIGSPSYYAIK